MLQQKKKKKIKAWPGLAWNANPFGKIRGAWTISEHACDERKCVWARSTWNTWTYGKVTTSKRNTKEDISSWLERCSFLLHVNMWLSRRWCYVKMYPLCSRVCISLRAKLWETRLKWLRDRPTKGTSVSQQSLRDDKVRSIVYVHVFDRVLFRPPCVEICPVGVSVALMHKMCQKLF